MGKEVILQALLTRVLELLNQQTLISGQTRNSGKVFIGLVLQHKGVKIRNRFPYSCGSECACFLLRVRVEVGSEIGLEGWPRSGLPNIFSMLCARCMCSTLLLFQAL